MAKVTPETQKKALSFADAAEFLIRRAQKPLSYKALTSIALDEKLIETQSETPAITMHVALRSDMKRREQRGEPQRFIFLGDGQFSLVELVAGTPSQKTKSALDQVRESRLAAAQDVYKRLTARNRGENFELMVSDLLVALGYQGVEVIGGRDDQGVDITCEKRDGVLKIRVAIQCKCKALHQKIGPKDVSTLRDNLSTYQCQQGILITTAELNEPAKAKAKEPGKEPIHFIEHGEILDLFAEHGIGIRNESLKFYQLDASKYDFLSEKENQSTQGSVVSNSPMPRASRRRKRADARDAG
jgi:restriction endonuclease Mrr